MTRLTVMVMVVMLISACAWAMDAKDVLDKVESVLEAPADRVAEVKLILTDKDGKTTERGMKLWEQGDKKLIKFTAPADVRGVGLLVLEEDQMYLWLPALGRIRRISAGEKGKSFMNTDFSYEELGSSGYEDDYEGTIIEETDSTWTLELVRKEGADATYSKLVMVVHKSDFLPRKIVFYNDSGEAVKELVNEEVKKIGKYIVPTRMVMTDLKKSHKTKMVMENVEFDTGLSTNVFTKRNLKRR